MPKGGPRVRAGRPPEADALRRDHDQATWVQLPDSRPGPTPSWPLTDPTERESVLWKRMWRKPQAVMWEANGQFEEVAMYVRSLVDAEKPEASVASRTLVRQWMDSLGLTEPGRLRNRWVISSAPNPEKRLRRTSGPSARERLERLKVVQGGEA